MGGWNYFLKTVFFWRVLKKYVIFSVCLSIEDDYLLILFANVSGICEWVLFLLGDLMIMPRPSTHLLFHLIFISPSIPFTVLYFLFPYHLMYVYNIFIFFPKFVLGEIGAVNGNYCWWICLIQFEHVYGLFNWYSVIIICWLNSLWFKNRLENSKHYEILLK